MSNSLEWQIIEPPDIAKILRALGHPEKKQYAIAIRTLASAKDPREHGVFKATLGCYVYYLTGSFRLKYDVNFTEHSIDILGLGDHKQVYGKDKHS